ncbi:MAG: YidB family protein [Rubrivivax sp.]|nr:YidB family protein [Rubrivivax sp.]MDP3616095.1 YidB family protein [Rubrivivax sp.]
MGLLDSVIGALGQSQPEGGGGGHAALFSAVIGMLAQGGGQGGGSGLGGLGGLGGLISKMQRSGLGDVAASWVGTGQNQPIGADQLGQVLGGDMIEGLTRQLGMNQGDLLGQLSQMLPQVVDTLTPEGRVPQGDLGGLLGSLLGGAQGGGGQSGGMGDLAGMLGGLLNKR